MKRRTLDITFAIGGALFSVLLLVLGLVLKDQADFSKTYVTDQLGAQKISFTPAKFLSDTEASYDCLVKYGTTDGDNTKGQLLDSGKKAECYANFYIATHMREAATGLGYDGATYATMGAYVRAGTQVSLVDQVKAATDAGDTTKATELQGKLDQANGLRGTLLTGETLRGLLLTSYGFSIFGDRADTAALVCFLAFGLLLLLAVAGIIHAFTSKKADDVVIAVEHHAAAG